MVLATASTPVMRLASCVIPVGTGPGAAFTLPSAGNLFCLPETGVCTQCQLLKCSAAQQGLLKEPYLCTLSLLERLLSQALCEYSSPRLGAKYGCTFSSGSPACNLVPMFSISFYSKLSKEGNYITDPQLMPGSLKQVEKQESQFCVVPGQSLLFLC